MKQIEELFLELIRDEPPLWQLKKDRKPWPSDEESCFPNPGIPMAMAIIPLLNLDPHKHDIKWENHFEGEKYGYKILIVELEFADMIPDGIDADTEKLLFDDNIPGPKETPDPGMGEEGEDPYNLFGNKEDE